MLAPIQLEVGVLLSCHTPGIGEMKNAFPLYSTLPSEMRDIVTVQFASTGPTPRPVLRTCACEATDANESAAAITATRFNMFIEKTPEIVGGFS